MCARCWLTMMLLLETRAWGGDGECPGCGDGAVTACPSQGGCTTEGEPCRDPACPRALGEPCGVYTLSCAPGLRCMTRADEKTPLHALLQGKGVCRKVGQQRAARNHTAEKHHPGEDNGGNVGRTTLHPLVPNHPAVNEEEAGPCQQHLTLVLRELRPSLFLNAKDMYIPNCDTRGFYRRKQCKSSKGQRRGHCWCVDKRGHKLPGSEGLKGNLHCPTGA